jgi:hypothetical protein
MTEHLNILIDEKNIDLWNELNEIYQIELIESPEPNYMSRVSGNIATICIYVHELSSASFTHELLHIYLKSKNVRITEDFYNAMENSERLNNLFSSDLKEHLTNCLEHKLMLPIFLEMGYENRFFISDYNEIKMDDKKLDALLSRYRVNGVYDKEAVDFFIGKFIAMKSCNNKSFKYYKYFKAFQKLDKRMHKLLSEFWSDWTTYDFQNDNDNYNEILEYFIEDLNGWISKKKIA